MEALGRMLQCTCTNISAASSHVLTRHLINPLHTSTTNSYILLHSGKINFHKHVAPESDIRVNDVESKNQTLNTSVIPSNKDDVKGSQVSISEKNGHSNSTHLSKPQLSWAPNLTDNKEKFHLNETQCPTAKFQNTTPSSLELSSKNDCHDITANSLPTAKENFWKETTSQKSVGDWDKPEPKSGNINSETASASPYVMHEEPLQRVKYIDSRCLQNSSPKKVLDIEYYNDVFSNSFMKTQGSIMSLNVHMPTAKNYCVINGATRNANIDFMNQKGQLPLSKFTSPKAGNFLLKTVELNEKCYLGQYKYERLLEPTRNIMGKYSVRYSSSTRNSPSIDDPKETDIEKKTGQLVSTEKSDSEMSAKEPCADKETFDLAKMSSVCSETSDETLPIEEKKLVHLSQNGVASIQEQNLGHQIVLSGKTKKGDKKTSVPPTVGGTKHPSPPASGGAGKKGGGDGKKKGSPPAAPGPQKAKMSDKELSSEPFLSGTSGSYIDEMHSSWIKDPKSVHKSWDVFFRRAEGGMKPGDAYQSPYGLSGCPSCSPGCPCGQANPGMQPGQSSAIGQVMGTAAAGDQNKLLKQTALQNIVQHYQMFGHFMAETDPLQVRGPALGTTFTKASDRQLPPHVKTVLEANNMSDMKEMFASPVYSNIAKPNEKSLPLEEIIKRLQDTYCGYVGIEFMHISCAKKKKWIREQFEPGMKRLEAADKKLFWKRLIHALAFEEFLSRKWPILFRFSVEGGETLIPVLHQIIDKCVSEGSSHFVIGMAHRGRLNVMANILNKELDKLFLHFRKDVDFKDHVGDVKYHLGCYVTQKHEASKKDITICILSNASHLESVNTILQGRTKAEQLKLKDETGTKVVPIVIHGDAAYAGQGVVYEQNTMCSLPEYNVHGMIHIVVNNNIGFTATPEESRSSRYCSDVAKLVDAPIFHINSEKPDEVVHCVNVASSFRNTFGGDVVLDLICFRQLGHNEADEPAYTSPIVYSKIRKRKRFPNAFGEQLIKEKVITEEEVKKEREIYFNKCEEAFKASTQLDSIGVHDWNDSPLKLPEDDSNEIKSTGVSKDTLKDIFLKSTVPPKGFEIHKVLSRVLKNRKKLLDDDVIDWAMAETIAYGSLLKDGINVRLTGQDSQRGTFSHRHHLFHHQAKEEKYIPLNNLGEKQGKYQLANSPLIEYGALGFEIGYAMSLANTLVLLEGQYGDFMNNAQAMIDLYLCCQETKWGRQCGLVLLLPHGLEGLGPEHSSARWERFLQLSGEEPDHKLQAQNELCALRNNNWIVANCTTPANYFHIIRRQIVLPFRKPLVLMSPKSQLRNPLCRSKLDDFDEGTYFRAVLPDDGAASSSPESVKRHIFCSGKVYFDLVENREKSELESSIAITRIEQLTPFPFEKVSNEIKKYSNAELCWVQEEHRNQGPWNYVLERFIYLDSKSIRYIGRPVSAVTAVSTPHKHNIERQELLNAAVQLNKKEE